MYRLQRTPLQLQEGLTLEVDSDWLILFCV